MHVLDVTLHIADMTRQDVQVTSSAVDCVRLDKVFKYNITFIIYAFFSVEIIQDFIYFYSNLDNKLIVESTTPQDHKSVITHRKKY